LSHFAEHMEDIAMAAMPRDVESDAESQSEEPSGSSNSDFDAGAAGAIDRRSQTPGRGSQDINIDLKADPGSYHDAKAALNHEIGETLKSVSEDPGDEQQTPGLGFSSLSAGVEFHDSEISR
jgi:hypothetical protein